MSIWTKLFGGTMCAGGRYGMFLVCLGACSCMSVAYDMRKLKQPVVMNDNPFVCSSTNAPALKKIDDYGGMTASSLVVASTGTGNSTQTTTQQGMANNAQVEAFKKIGGDPHLTITHVRLNSESIGVYLLFVAAESVSIHATGSVCRVESNQTTAPRSAP